MKYLPLLWASLWRRHIRSVLTALSIAVAFLLFGLLHGVTTAFDGAIAKLGDTRLRVVNRANILASMPISYEARIAAVPGVRATTHIAGFVGYYQERKNGLSIAALDIDSFLDAIPNLRVPADQRDAMRTVRTGALVGYELAKRFNWKIGDRVTLHSMLWVDEHGSADWPRRHRRVLQCGSRRRSAVRQRSVLELRVSRLDAGSRQRHGPSIHRIDRRPRALERHRDRDRSAVRELELRAQMFNEKEWITNSLRQTGNLRMFVNSIIGAVLFTLLFLAGNTMSQSVRDRISELGVLKALGFRDSAVALLVVVEAAILTLAGAALGLAVTGLIFPRAFGSLGALGPTPLPIEACVSGAGIALLMALLSAALPAIQARRLTVAEALAGH